jgi:hypothetical protein
MVNFTLPATSHVRGATSPRKAVTGREGYHHPIGVNKMANDWRGFRKILWKGI